MTDSDQIANNANEGEFEGVPEPLLERERDLTGAADNRRWRYAVRDVDAMDHAGPGVWTQVGPAPLLIANQQIFQGVGPDSGEVVDIAIDPRTEKTHTMYAAAGNGGLWKTTDGGASWRPTTDQLAATAIGAVALDPAAPDTVYIGTGNLFVGAAGMPKSAGLFKSVDGGRSWARLYAPAGRPPQPITAAVNVAGGVRVTVAAHGYASIDRVIAVGLPGVTGAAGEGQAQRIDDNTLRITGVTINAAYGGAGATLYDARQPPFLSDRGVVRMVCPAAGSLLVASEAGLYYSKDGGRNFGANFPAYDDGKPVRTGLISALELDQGWTRTIRVAEATPTSPITVTLPGHGFAAGDPVVLGGVTTNTAANGRWLVDVADADHVTLRDSNGNGAGAVTGFAVGPAHPVTQPVTAATNPAAPAPIVLTAAAHGFVTGDVVAVCGVTGNTGANGSWPIRVLTPDTLALVGTRATGAYTGGGVIDGPRHPAPRVITAAVNVAGGAVRVTTNVPHGLLTGDRASVLGLPGVAAPGNSASVTFRTDTEVQLGGLTMNAAYAGGGTLVGPADSWNTAYFAAAGRIFGTSTLNTDRGLFRLTVTSTGELVFSDNLMSHSAVLPTVFGRVAFCQSLLPRTRTLYIAVQDSPTTGAIFIGLFRSDDFGGTWVSRPALATPVALDKSGRFTAYAMLIAVDPQDSRRVYAAQTQLRRSLDSGGTWPVTTSATRGGVDRISGFGSADSTTLLHWDHHEMVFPPATWWEFSAGNPVQPTPAYHGTDGGIARSGVTATGAMTFTALNEGIATSLLTSLDIGRGAGRNAVTFGGMQDTGTGGHRRGDATGVWVEGVDGDGGPVAVDPFDPDIVFGTDGHNLMRTTNGGNTWFLANRPRVVPIESVASTNPVTVTTAGHSFRTGDVVTIAGVPGSGPANGASTITVVDARTFTLNGKNGAAAVFGPFPTVTGDRYLTQHDIVAATSGAPIEIETAAPHGCVNGQKVRIDAVEGTVAANNTVAHPSWQVTVISPTRLSLDGTDGGGVGVYVRNTGRMRGPAANGAVSVFSTVFAPNQPIVVTAQGHGFVSGDPVTVTGVVGNTNANVVGAPITVLDANSFVLDGVNGNAAPGPMPRVSGGNIGRGLPASSYIERIALVPNAAGPSTKVFFSQDHTLFRSTNGGITFVAMATFSDFISALHAPDDHRLWVATSGLTGTNRRYRVHFSTTDGATFDGATQQFVGDIGARSFISQIIEDPAGGGQRVAVVCAGYSRTATQRRTRHVFLSQTQGRTAGGATAWTEVGGVFDAATGNLPDVPVTGAAWDTTVNPSQLLAASDLGVLRLDPAGPSWTRFGPNLPRAGVEAIAADQDVVRIATYGRSAWELTLPPGPSLYVEADLGFGDQQMGLEVRRRLVLHSVGKGDVTITGLDGATSDVRVEPVPPAVNLTPKLASGARQACDVVFKPTALGDRGTTLTVSSDDPDHPTIELKMTGFGIAAGAPRLSARAFVEFGVVRTTAPSTISLELRNVGDGPLSITGLAPDPAGSPTFTLPAPPALPLVVPPSGSVSVPVSFAPTGNGSLRGALIVTAAGQGQVVTLSGTGTTTAAGMVAVLFNQLGIGGPPEELA